MPTPKLTVEDCIPVFEAINQALREGYKLGGMPSAKERAAKMLNTSPGHVAKRYKAGLDFGLSVEVPPAAVAARREDGPAAPDRVRHLIAKRPHSLAELAQAAEASIGEVLNCLDDLAKQGVNVFRRGDVFEIPKDVAPSFRSRERLQYVSRPDNTFVFGASGDQHVGSKYCRYDVLDDLYDRFEQASVDRVFNTGNWIDGECRFNKFDLEVHGLEAQCRLLAERFPQRSFDTYAIWGDDHEGWLAQREGVDVGRYAESVMRQAGREDWIDIGFMEGHVELVNANTGATAVLAVVHPGGGSAYALSYSIQKIVESYEGGEKPHVALYGHYHKLWAGLVRNVWVLQTGCAQDQTVFMRKKRLEAHVGGAIVKLEQDPGTGAILSFAPQLIRYFNKEWYVKDGQGNGRWSYTDAARPVPRSTAAIR